jgi:hypothetical protein
MKKLFLTLFIVATLSTTTVLLGTAIHSEKTYDQKTNADFYDIDSSHWAYKPIKYMVQKGILKGYSNHQFKPQNKISREEFATIMVKALEMEITNPNYSTFKDVPIKSWSYKYVETAKNYLTGYKIGGDLYYKPQESAVREDMAVALVLALDIPTTDVQLSLLNDFADKDSVSLNLQKYVALALQHNIMSGYPEDENGVKHFKPFGQLTRAEASVLLFNTLKIKGLVDEEFLDGEKIVFGESEKVVIDQEPEPKPYQPSIPEYFNPENSNLSLHAKIHDGEINLEWSKPSTFEGFKYYKIVASKYKEVPKYPEDGYLTCITNKYNPQYNFHGKHQYHGGDVGHHFESGESYYFSITYVYNDDKLYSESVKLIIP